MQSKKQREETRKNKKKAIALLVAGHTPESAAEKLGLCERTIQGWKAEDKNFAANLAKATKKANENRDIPPPGEEITITHFTTLDTAAYKTLLNRICNGDGHLSLDYLKYSERLKAAAKRKNGAVQKFKVSFGSVPNDIVPPPIEAPAPNVIQMRREQA